MHRLWVVYINACSSVCAFLCPCAIFPHVRSNILWKRTSKNAWVNQLYWGVDKYVKVSVLCVDKKSFVELWIY